MGRPARSRSPATEPPPAVTGLRSSKISFRSRKIVKTASAKPLATTALALAPQAPPPPVLPALSSPGELAAALRHLQAADPLLTAVIANTEAPTFTATPSLPAFHSLARSILYQQLATSAADAIYARFLALLPSASAAAAAVAADAVTPAAVLALAAADLRTIGVSGRKASYLHDLAARFAAGELSDSAVAAMDEAALLAELTKVRGVGEWTVHMFMIFSLHRPDILPCGDLGVRKGVQELYKLKSLPNPEEMAALCERWRPYRSVGAWYMWRLMESKGAASKKKNKGNASS
ncbi:DNA-3-methyladenine glycosylase 1 [Zea mays]|jgi:DNA-3-methyladenine glycosylase II|uniref:DNA-3-methyladenine glycosylase 1 n=1 Tax=Zea mays TaxID=4577 RepID=B6U6Y8_MAIZE|nr:DNA-3-methyladenine glycosylase 1 [Zea mays]ACG45121.1 DNA-3-methyladenine glycosylase 1 [Zea mays]AQK88611.1 DNA-3-methyladenine glycosylase 1 [Zea mays]|eukprot:NP_001151950.1 DNA-3-methyladenine glycosylase 1 [Zea mays]